VVVADTSVLIDHLRGDPSARDVFRGARERGEAIAGSVLTRVEVLAGVRSRERAGTEALLSELEWIPVDEDLADIAGRLANRFSRSHGGIDVVDYVVAATVQKLEAVLWTTNVRHFPMFPRLKAPY
jgi:predicted nucleic acid-binding protein